MSRHDHYILDEHGEPKPVDLLTWAAWFETADRVVAQDADEQTGWLVSTVFLGLDHSFGSDGPPVLWETLVFRGPYDGEMRRYSSREAAEAGHREVCVRVAELVALGVDEKPDRDAN